MTQPISTADHDATTEHHQSLSPPSPEATPEPSPSVQSMHEGIEVWDGCGSCGIEPYWLEIGAEMDGVSDRDREDDR